MMERRLLDDAWRGAAQVHQVDGAGRDLLVGQADRPRLGGGHDRCLRPGRRLRRCGQAREHPGDQRLHLVHVDITNHHDRHEIGPVPG